MPVVRNPQFYFREGFCWNNVITTYMKCKRKEKTVQSTESMSFFSMCGNVPEYYMICLMNSLFAALYVDSFVNSTSHCTTGDAKLIPVVVPSEEQLKKFKALFDRLYELKQSVAKQIATDAEIQPELKELEELNDRLMGALILN